MTEREVMKARQDEFWIYLQAMKKAKAEGRTLHDKKLLAARRQMAHKPYGRMVDDD